MSYFKVIVINCDVFESTIIDERHFKTQQDAKVFAESYKDMVTIIVTM